MTASGDLPEQHVRFVRHRSRREDSPAARVASQTTGTPPSGGDARLTARPPGRRSRAVLTAASVLLLTTSTAFRCGAAARLARTVVRVHVDTPSAACGDGRSISVRLDDGETVRQVGCADATEPSASGRATRPYETARRDTLAVRAVLVTAGGDTLASAAARLPLEPDWRWEVHVRVGDTRVDPEPGAMGLAGATSAPLHAAGRRPGSGRPNERLYLFWGGDRLSQELVY